MANKTFQIPKEFVEEKKTLDTKITFWIRSNALKRFDTICSVSHVDRSKVLRLLVDLFLNDDDFQERVLGGLSNG